MMWTLSPAMTSALSNQPTLISVIRSIAIGALLLVGATALNIALDGRQSLISQAFVYVLCVVIAARYVMPVVSIGVALAAVAALNFFFIAPRYTLVVEHSEHAFALVGMLVLAVVISRMAADLRNEAVQATTHARRAQQLQTLATDLADTRTERELRDVAERHLHTWLPAGTAIRFDSSPSGEAGLSDEVLMLTDGPRCLGVWSWTTPSQQHDPDFKAHLQASTALLSQALRRVIAREAQRAAEADAELQRVRSSFLAAVSHDLRTPLATIVGAASALRLQQDKLSLSDRQQLLDSIVQEAQYLSNVADNTLQLVRLSAAEGALITEWESVEEVVGAALSRVRPLDIHHRIHANVSGDLPLIRGNAILLVQLLVNLLDNAMRHACGQVHLHAHALPGQLIAITVEDEGRNIDYTSSVEPHQSRETAGLGLTLCHVIAKAHDATLDVRAKTGGGTRVTLTLKAAADTSVNP